MSDLNLFYSPEEQANFTPQQRRAIELGQNRRCPCCGARLTLWETFCLVFGFGVPYDVMVVERGGDIRVVHEREMRPQTMYTELPGEEQIARQRGYESFRQRHNF